LILGSGIVRNVCIVFANSKIFRGLSKLIIINCNAHVPDICVLPRS
jgi:hypothetical protein